MIFLKLLLGCLILIFSKNVKAEQEMFYCIEENTTIQGWEFKKIWEFWKDTQYFSSSSSSAKNPISIKLIIDENEAKLVGNQGEAILQKVSPNQYLEKNQLGDVFLWSIFKSEGNKPIIVFQQKAYQVVGATAVSTAYKCK